MNLVETYGYSQDELSRILGKSRSHVTNILRLDKLPEAIKQKLVTKELSFGHARALVVANNPIDLAEMILAKNLTVRQTEKLIKNQSQEPNLKKSRSTKNQKADIIETSNDDFTAIAENLSSNLNLLTSIVISQDGKNHLKIEFSELEELDKLIMLLMKSHY